MIADGMLIVAGLSIVALLILAAAVSHAAGRLEPHPDGWARDSDGPQRWTDATCPACRADGTATPMCPYCRAKP